MIRLQLPENLMDSGLAMPESTPKTLIEIDSESLPYACQCPCCGSLFNIPEGLLFKVEEDEFLDDEFTDDESSSGESIDIDVQGGSAPTPGNSSTQPSGAETTTPEVGESNDTFV